MVGVTAYCVFSGWDIAAERSLIMTLVMLGAILVAEGVETYAAALTLLRHGCHRAQGFLLSRPIPGDAMESLFAEGRIPVSFSKG